MTWQKNKREHSHASSEREFYVNRSVGCGKIEKIKRTNVSRSDANIRYRNVTQIPIEIENLVQVSAIPGDFYVQFYSSSAMLLRLKALTNNHKTFRRHYFELFDVQMLTFPSRDVPKIYASHEYKKVLPTPLCFRDFNDYYMKHEATTTVNSNCADDVANSTSKTAEFNNDDDRYNFILKTSIKFQRNLSKISANNKDNLKVSYDDLSTTNSSKKMDVYDVSNKYTEFKVFESNFTSYALALHSTVFHYLNHDKYLNLSCTLHDQVHLSYSHDLLSNTFCNATLEDEWSGMICSIDINEISHHNVTLSYAHDATSSDNRRRKMVLRIIDVNAVEVNWDSSEKLNEHKIDVVMERKRIFFRNGFILHQFSNGMVKIHSFNGAIYEIVENAAESYFNENMTEKHQFMINAIKFLPKYGIDVTTFRMTLPSGEIFLVNNDSIVDELKPKLLNDRTGNLTIENSTTKCTYPYEAITVTTDYNCNDIVLSCGTPEMRNSLPYNLAQFGEAEIESNIIVDDVLNCINNDYFVSINRQHVFEDEKCGIFKFSQNSIQMSLRGDVEVNFSHDSCAISMKNGIFFRVNKFKMQFHDTKCDVCSRYAQKMSLTFFISGISMKNFLFYFFSPLESLRNCCQSAE
jgi:hypothetical protein